MEDYIVYNFKVIPANTNDSFLIKVKKTLHSEQFQPKLDQNSSFCNLPATLGHGFRTQHNIKK